MLLTTLNLTVYANYASHTNGCYGWQFSIVTKRWLPYEVKPMVIVLRSTRCLLRMPQCLNFVDIV